MKELHRSKMHLLFHDKNGVPKNVNIMYVTQGGEVIDSLTVRVTSITNHGHSINVVLPNTNNVEHRTLLDTLIMEVDGVRIR